VPTAHIIVHGIVQGVGFRWFVNREANALGLYGTVKNLSDGDVEIWAEGDRTAIDELIDSIKRGNGSSSVYRLKLEWVTGEPRFEEFKITYNRW